MLGALLHQRAVGLAETIAKIPFLRAHLGAVSLKIIFIEITIRGNRRASVKVP